MWDGDAKWLARWRPEWIGDVFNLEPKLDLSDWSDRHRVLNRKGSAEPGKWHTDRTPYLREIMEALSPSSEVTDVWVMKGAQLGFTEMGVNWIGYTIDQDPGPMLWVEPTLDMMKKLVKQRIDPLIDDTPAIARKLPMKRAKDGGNSLFEKQFPGGVAYFTGANSAAALRSIPIAKLGLDELDAYPVDLDGEGDPGELAKARTRTFRRAKRLYISTPTIKGVSRIEAGYDRTDQREFFVPCPSCGELQTIEWGRMRWDASDNKSMTWLECEHNGCVIEETSKPQMLRAGEWRPTNEDNASATVRGYHISSLYSPLGWFSWNEARAQYDASRQDRTKAKSFVNLVLGESYGDEGEAPGWETLYARRNNRPLGTVPEEGRMLVCGVDVQRDRLEAQVIAFGEDLWSHPIEYLIFPGDTLDIDSPNSPWLKLDELLVREWPHELGGRISLRMMGVDSGYNTQAVYRWARRHGTRRVAIVKGRDTLESPVSSPTHQDVKENGKRIRRGVMIWPVGVSMLKGELYDSLRRHPPAEGEDPPSRWVDFPQLPQEYFEQLCAEELVTRVNRRGYVAQEWRKTRDRNEALDTAVYARAASVIAGLDRMQSAHFEEIRKALLPPPEEADKPKKTQKRDRQSIWKSRHDV